MQRNQEMPTLEKITELVLEAARSIKDGPVDRDAALFGDGGWLDSFGLVTLVTVIEQVVEERLQARIVLADDRAMSTRQSPFRSVASLAAYVATLVEEAARG
jgi:acyl carrier protein